MRGARGWVALSIPLLLLLAACGLPGTTKREPLTEPTLSPRPALPALPPVGRGTPCPHATDEQRLLAAYRSEVSRPLAGESGVRPLDERTTTCEDGRGRLSLIQYYSVPLALRVEPYQHYAPPLAAAGWRFAGVLDDDGIAVTSFCNTIGGLPATLTINRVEAGTTTQQLRVSVAAGCTPGPVASPESPAPVATPRVVHRYPGIPEGVLRWRTTLGAPVIAPPSGVAGLLVVAGDAHGIDNNLYGLDPKTGREVWRTRVPGEVLRQATDGIDTVYAVSGPFQGSSVAPAYLNALDARTGRLLWVALTWPAYGTDIVFGSASVYSAEGEGQVAAFDAATGRLRWRAAVGVTDSTSLAAADGQVYVGTGDAPVRALDGATGAVRWTSTVSGGVGTGSHRVYVCGPDATVRALDPVDGRQLWRMASIGCGPRPSEVDGRVYAAGATTSSVDAATGTQRWDATEGPGYTVVAEARGLVYGVGDQTGLMYALNAANGQPVWESVVDLTAVSGHTPAVVVGDVVCVTGGSGTVWAFAAR